MTRKQAETVLKRIEAGGEVVALRHERGPWMTRGQGDRKGMWVALVFGRSNRRAGSLVIDPTCPHLAEVAWDE